MSRRSKTLATVDQYFVRLRVHNSKPGDIDLNEPAPGASNSERQVPPIPDINASFLP